ncbi:MAG TPA: choice-of-anchor D domain-containing protein [Edaphobacter sp.]
MTARFRSFCVFCLFPFALLLAGCTTQTPAHLPSFTMAKHGSVHGGQQPVSGATIQLYAVGSSGDGSAATPLLTNSATSDANGNFSISSYSCPTAASLVYIVASGGNPGLAPGTNNTALNMMAALGRCDSVGSSFIVVNELTTVAAVSALSPFLASPGNVGSSSADASSLANAFALASEFVNSSTGLAPGSNVPAGLVVPIDKINTLADVVAVCINSAGGIAGDGSSCGTLFPLTTLAGFPPPTDIITALLNVANDPPLNTAALFNLVVPTAPFQPQLTAVPADFSIRLTTVGSSGGSTGPVTLSPTTLTFYQTNVPQSVTMTNSGLTPVVIQSLDISSSNWSQTNDCGTVLQAQSICTISVQSTNSALGTFSGTLTVVDDDTNDTQVVQLNTDNETLVGTIDFGSWSIGSSGTSRLAGGVLVQTGSVSGSNPGDFSFASDWQGPLPVPFTCQGLGGRSGGCNNLYFFFTPTTVGTRSALLTTDIGTYLLTGTGLKHGPYFSFDSGNYDFGSTAAGSQTLQPLVITSYGDAPVTLLPPVIGGTNASDFAVTSTCTVIPAATSGYLDPSSGHIYIQRAGARSTCTLNVTFTPSADGSRSATLTETDSVGLQQTVTLTGSGASSSPPTANPTTLSFGNVQAGMTASQSVTVTSANQAAVTAQISGSTNYTVQPSSCAQGTPTCTFTVTFSPTASGAINDVLTLSSQGSLTTTPVPLTGSGIASAVSLSPTSLSFPARNIGTTSLAQTVTLTNTGSAPLHISNVSLTTTNLGEFFSTGTCSASAVIATGQTCTLSVSFAPQTTGTKTGLLQIFSDALTSPDTIQLSGVAQ